MSGGVQQYLATATLPAGAATPRHVVPDGTASGAAARASAPATSINGATGAAGAIGGAAGADDPAQPPRSVTTSASDGRIARR